MKIVITRKIEQIETKISLFSFGKKSFCPKCHQTAGLISLNEIVESYGLEIEKIYQLIHRGKFHPIHIKLSELYICENSLFKFFEQKKLNFRK